MATGKAFNNVSRVSAATLAVVFATAASAANIWEPPKKKVIAAGWDIGNARPEVLLENADLLDQTGLEGVVVPLPRIKCPDGNWHKLGWETMTSDFITEDVLGKYVPIYKELTSKHKAFRESFFGCNWCPISTNRFDWTDDAAWAKFTANMREVASIAKRGGFVGILADGEDYGNKQLFFRKFDDPPQAELVAIARKRGRQIGRAMFGEFPDMKLMSFWFLSLNKNYARSTDASAAMRGRGDLWPMFINGLLDVMPPGVDLIDGDEFGYGYNAECHDFEESSVRQRTRALALIAPENRAKYRTQMRVGFGLYLDRYIRPEGSAGAVKAKRGSRLETLRDNLEEALYAADEYVWLWGETQRWVKWRNFKSPFAWMKIGEERWEDKLPGLTAMLREAKNPKAEIDAKLAAFKASGAKNLLAKAVESKASNWQGETSKGTFTPMPGKGTDGGTLVVAEDVSNGCFVLDVSGVNTGDVFYVEAFVRGKGADCAELRWKKNGVWAWCVECVDESFGAPDADGWRRMAARTPPVPKNMTGVTLKIDVKQKPGEKVELDRVAIFKR